ncbi:uncharacterized protein LOC134537072 [Bacillus rossius redtenbacheri]|uniref:uncharacterized protein LOC134537072 n=1 Tax=Bacillus rossius redtenbacheri TaxID=93214 RepID=UPI002FDDF0B4
MMAAANDVPELGREEEEEEEEDSDDWSEVDAGDRPSVTCLFCPGGFETVGAAVGHCKRDHQLDLLRLRDRLGMDCYSFIKLVNYVRARRPEPAALMDAKEAFWDAEEFLQPAYEDDPWLMFDIDDLEEPSPELLPANNGFYVANAENGRVTLTEQHFSELQRTIQSLTAQVREKDALLEAACQDMQQMRTAMRALIASGDAAEGAGPRDRTVASLRASEDEGYFSTYAHFSIHHEMLSDRVRTLSYRDALVGNSALLEGKTVLDLGCGTGILSMFAASAGAKQVVAIDQSDIVYHAMDIIRQNGLSDKVTVLKGRLEDTALPVDKVDVIVSEWMGYFLLYEGMLDSVLYARDHLLVPGGRLLPNRCSLSLVGVADPDHHERALGFWTDVYGYSMACLRPEVAREPAVETVGPDRVATAPGRLLELDLHTCGANSADFSAEFSLRPLRDCALTALAGYFDVFFDLPSPVTFSTGPHAPPTHWKQTVFLLGEPLPVKRDECIEGKLVCQRHPKDLRTLTMSITICGRTHKYVMS